jgi:hypothetical protein
MVVEPSEAASVKDASEDDIFNIPGVVGVGSSESDTMTRQSEAGQDVVGADTVERGGVIVVDVVDESAAEQVPDQINGVPVVVNITGEIRLMQETAERVTLQANSQERRAVHRPVVMGVSMASETGSACTSSYLMEDPETGDVYAVQNFHCNMGNGQSVGDQILQPGPADGGRAQNTVAEVAGAVDIQPASEGTNPVDMMWMRPTEEFSNEVLEVPGNNIVEPPVHEPSVGDEVIKSGRTTGTTTAEVTSVDHTVRVSGKHLGFEGQDVKFRDQIQTGYMSEGGDSSSALLYDDGDVYRPVGMLFAGAANNTYHNTASTMVEASGLVFMGSDADQPGATPSISVSGCEVSSDGVSVGDEFTVDVVVDLDCDEEADVSVEVLVGGVTAGEEEVTVPPGESRIENVGAVAPEEWAVGVGVTASVEVLN